MSNLSKREKTLLIILLIAIIGYIYYSFLMIPQLDNLSFEKEKLAANKTVLSELKNSQNDIDTIKKEVETLNIKASESMKSIPDSSRIPEIIMDFKSLEDSSGCTGGRLIFSSPIASSANQVTENTDADNNIPGVMVLPIDYQANGSFNNIMSLIKFIENNKRKMIINEISINKDPQSNLLTANISINCFYLNKNNIEKVDYPFINSITGKQNIFD